MVFTRLEKEQRIIEMYEAGHTIREIAKVVHMSFGPIGNIIRKATGDSNKDSNNEHTKSRETEALKLFQEGKEPVEVATILDISSDETEDLYLGYLRLKNLHHFVLIYKEMKYKLPSLIKLYRMLRIAGIREENTVDLIKDTKRIPFLRNTFLELTNANTSLQKQNNNLVSELSRVQNEVDTKQGYLQWYALEMQKIIFEIEERKRELQYLDQLTKDKMKGYVRYRKSGGDIV